MCGCENTYISRGSRAFAVAGNAYMKEVNVYKKLKKICFH